MARRNGRKGDNLFTDYYTGRTVYASKVRQDYWKDWTAIKPLERNLQEISTPLNDPYPLPMYSGPQYEQGVECAAEQVPLYIGKTTRPFPTNNFIVQALDINPGIGEMAIGCTFRVS